MWPRACAIWVRNAGGATGAARCAAGRGAACAMRLASRSSWSGHRIGGLPWLLLSSSDALAGSGGHIGRAGETIEMVLQDGHAAQVALEPGDPRHAVGLEVDTSEVAQHQGVP